VDEAKLAALRARYAASREIDVAPPELRAALALAFETPSDSPRAQSSRGIGDRRKLPYAGVSTLLDLPYLPQTADVPDPAGLDVALIGVPMDLGVTNRAGARLGPRAVRAVERIGPYHHALKIVPRALCAAADIGDVPFSSRYSLDSSIADIERFYARIAAAGVRPVSVGGDHSITYPILKALGAGRPLGCVHIDAHCDTMGEYEGTNFHHGGPFRQAVLAGALDPERTVQIGIRGPAEILWGFSYESGMTVLHIEDVERLGVEAIVERARAVVGDGPTYISFDVDGLDPAFAPGTGTPEAGGLTPREAQAILRGLAGLDIVGGDVVEVAPQYDPTSNTAMVGAQMLFEIFSLIALGPQFNHRDTENKSPVRR
jgi:guanidinopropionase